MSEANDLDLESLTSMPHLKQSTGEAVDTIAKRFEKLEEQAAESEDLDDPRLQEEYTFRFHYVDGRKRVHRGEFTNKVLSIRDRQAVGALQAQWQLGYSHSGYDPEISAMNYVLAHMAVSLSPGTGAEWAKDLRGLRDVDLIQKLYEEVQAHEARFHGRQVSEGEG